MAGRGGSATVRAASPAVGAVDDPAAALAPARRRDGHRNVGRETVRSHAWAAAILLIRNIEEMAAFDLRNGAK